MGGTAWKAAVDRRAIVLPALVAVAFIVLQLVDVASYPLAVPDEAFLNDAALQLVRTGRFHDDVLRLNSGFESGPYFWQPPGLALVQAGIYKLAGFGIVQTRLNGIIFGGLACGALCALVYHLTGRPIVALGAALVPCVWPTFLLSAKMGRMDMHAIFFLLLATLSAVRSLETDDIRWRLAMGACLGIAGIFHPAAATWAAALVLAFAWQVRRHPLRLAPVLVAAAALPGAWLAYGLLHFDAFEGQFLVQLFGRSAHGDLWARLHGGLIRYEIELGRAPLMLPLLLLSAAIGWRRVIASRPLTMLAATTALTFVLVFVTAGYSYGFYQLYSMTCLLIVAAAVIPATGQPRAVAGSLAAVLLASAAVVSYAPRAVALVGQAQARDYRLQFVELTRRLRAGDQVWGTGVVWYAVAGAGGRLDAHEESVPVRWTSKPDAARHRYVVVLKGETFPTEGFVRVGTFGEPLPVIWGSSYAHGSYVYELWQSVQLADAAR